MRYPNQRYGDPAHLRYYTQGWTLKQISQFLKRDEKTIKSWLGGKSKVPFWVPELLRLSAYEKQQQLRYMGVNTVLAKLGVVNGEVLEFKNMNETRFKNAAKPKLTAIEDSNQRIIKEIKYK
jgi:hypothetical protein